MAHRRLFARRPQSNKLDKDKGVERIESWRVNTLNEGDKKRSVAQSSSRKSQEVIQDVKRAEPAPISRTVPFVEKSRQAVIAEVQRAEQPPLLHEESSCQEVVKDFQRAEPARVSQTVSSCQLKRPTKDCQGSFEADGQKEMKAEQQLQPETSHAGQPKKVTGQDSGTLDSGLDDDIDDDDDASMADEASEKVRNAYQRWRTTRLNGKLQQSEEQTADGSIFSNITTS